jgi:archaemetzincin
MRLLSLAVLVLIGCKGQPPQDPPKGIEESMERIRSLHEKMKPPRPGDWLDRFDEPGQTFEEYLECDPITAKGKRNVIYVQPVGDFTDAQRRIVDLSAEFLGLYFNVEVKIRKDIPLSEIPARARRTHPSWGDKQILSTYVLDHVLRPRLPDDAVAYIAFTSSDLWPGKGWNFVFGQASRRGRVGVWSIYRHGAPKTEFELCLLRTLKTATHETGHMFSILHCIAYECNMCGSNSRRESDRRPLAMCPEDAAKLWWATDADPIGRYTKLRDFCRREGLKAEAGFYERSIEALK